jgi:hypothetical protein
LPEQDFQQIVFREFALFLDPLLRTEGDPDAVATLCRELGWDLSSLDASSAARLVESVLRLVGAADEIQQLVGSPPTDLAGLAKALGTAASVLRVVIDTAAALPQLGTVDYGEIAVDLISGLTITYLTRRCPLADATLRFLTIIRELPEEHVVVGGKLVRLRNQMPRLELTRIAELLSNPGRVFEETYWPGGFADLRAVTAVAERLFPRCLDVLSALSSGDAGVVASFGRKGVPLDLAPDEAARLDRVLSFFWDRRSAETGGRIRFGSSLGLLAENEGGPGVFLVPFGAIAFSHQLAGWKLSGSGELDPGGFQITGAGLSTYAAGGNRLRAQLLLEPANDEGPDLLIGDAEGTRFQVRNLSVRAMLEFAEAREDLGVMLAVDEGAVVIQASPDDGFLGAILPEDGAQLAFGFRVGWTKLGGFHFDGSGGFEIKLPTHIDIGPLALEDVTLRALFSGSGVPISISATVRADLGPLKASVEGLGISLKVAFTEGGGNLGPVDLQPGIKPPTGVGLSLDAGAVRGGGYLSFDFDRGEYAGVVQLSILDMVSVNAIGLITTKMPDGSEGFSLLVILTVEFNPGIQLGMGFALIGLGGLVGLNRTMALEALVQGVRSGTLNSILFPQGDIVANAARIISDLRAIFPPKRDTFLIGPMAKLGWGTPTLVSVSFGIIIEIPGNVAILGVLRLNLPTADAPLIVLQVAFVGAIEFDKQRLWFFASLFESRILFITLEGEFGLLVGWGPDAAFVFSVGGFHPTFAPPPLPFPSPARLALAILDEENAMVRIEAYFAVTSNTVQIGASVQLRFGFDSFGIEGHLGFDALFQFSPFYFIFSVNISLSLRAFGIDVLSVRVDMSLEGPTPWHAFGTGSVSLLFFTISANFDVTWGDSAETTLPPIAVRPLLLAELEKMENWTAVLPAGNLPSVTLRPLEDAQGALTMHPLGALRFSQRAIPLGIALDKVGTQRPSDARHFTLSVAAGSLRQRDVVRESFAMAQFQDMDDATKLSRPSFEKQVGGLDLIAGGAELSADFAVQRKVRREEVILDGAHRARARILSHAGLFAHQLLGSAVAQNERSQAARTRLNPFPGDAIEVVGPSHTIVDVDTNRPFRGTTAVFASEAEARAQLKSITTSNRRLVGRLQVVPTYEVAA